MESISQEGIIAYLIGMVSIHKKKLNSALSGIYLHGSLVNVSGTGFSADKSDVDLLLTISLATARERINCMRELNNYRLKPIDLR